MYLTRGALLPRVRTHTTAMIAPARMGTHTGHRLTAHLYSSPPHSIYSFKPGVNRSGVWGAALGSLTRYCRVGEPFLDCSCNPYGVYGLYFQLCCL